MWGYKEMVFDLRHMVALIECEVDAIEVFYRRQAEIDEWQELRNAK
jgi:hypothetical protein